MRRPTVIAVLTLGACFRAPDPAHPPEPEAPPQVADAPRALPVEALVLLEPAFAEAPADSAPVRAIGVVLAVEPGRRLVVALAAAWRRPADANDARWRSAREAMLWRPHAHAPSEGAAQLPLLRESVEQPWVPIAADAEGAFRLAWVPDAPTTGAEGTPPASATAPAAAHAAVAARAPAAGETLRRWTGAAAGEVRLDADGRSDLSLGIAALGVPLFDAQGRLAAFLDDRAPAMIRAALAPTLGALIAHRRFDLLRLLLVEDGAPGVLHDVYAGFWSNDAPALTRALLAQPFLNARELLGDRDELPREDRADLSAQLLALHRRLQDPDQTPRSWQARDVAALASALRGLPPKTAEQRERQE